MSSEYQRVMFPWKILRLFQLFCFRCELAAKEEIREKTQELQEQKRETEGRQLAKEKECILKASKMEEGMTLLVQQNTKLQVCRLS